MKRNRLSKDYKIEFRKTYPSLTQLTKHARRSTISKQSFQVDGPQNREISLFIGNTIGRFLTITFQGGKTSATSCDYGPISLRPAAFITELLALFTLYFGIASESDVVEPGDDMQLLCLFPMATRHRRDKLMCRRRLSSLLTNTFICFGGCWTLCGKNVKINNYGGSRECPLSRWLG